MSECIFCDCGNKCKYHGTNNEPLPQTRKVVRETFWGCLKRMGRK